MRFFKNKLGTGFELVEPDTAYIHLSRHYGKTFTVMNHIDSLITQGKRVKVVDYNRVQQYGSTFKPTVIDFDFVGNNPNSVWEVNYMGEWVYKEPKMDWLGRIKEGRYEQIPKSEIP